MSQQSIDESIDYVLKYNLYFYPKRQLYQYLHQMAQATNKPEIANVYMHACSELSPGNASEYSIPQHVEKELLESIVEATKEFKELQDSPATWFKELQDSPTTWFKTLKESRRPKENKGMKILLLCALATGNAEVTKFALKEFYNRGKREKVKALMWATQRGKTECVKTLLEANADVNAQEEHGWTALMMAAILGHTECVKTLLEANADVNAQEKDGQTALMWAAIEGHTECVKTLLEANADVNAQEKDGWTALMRAAQKGNTECVKTLLEANADVNAQEKDGWTALMMAAQKGHTECVKALLAAKANWQLKSQKGNTAEDIAKTNKNKEVTQILAELRERLTAQQKQLAEQRAEKQKQLVEQRAEKQKFWKECYTLINVGIAITFTAWIIIKWSIKGNGDDGFSLFAIVCLVVLIIKTLFTMSRDDTRPDNKLMCILYGITDFFCAMALCLPAISRSPSREDFLVLILLVHVPIAIFSLWLVLHDAIPEESDFGSRALSICNVLIAITVFYFGGGVLTGSYNFWDNILAALTLGY